MDSGAAKTSELIRSFEKAIFDADVRGMAMAYKALARREDDLAPEEKQNFTKMTGTFLTLVNGAMGGR